MPNKPAVTSVAVHPLIAQRWSPRAFEPNQPVSADDLTAFLEAARWAPSCFNDQPWRFVVCDKSTNPGAWARALDVINEKNRLWARNAPVLILSVAMANFNHNGQANRWAMYDTGAATLSLCLQAGALGLASHQMGGFDAAAARQAFGLPEDCTPMAMLAIGYPADPENLPEEFRQAELATRRRAELRERAYFGHWEE